MGLRDEIAADIADAFDGDLADAVKSFTGERVIGTSYDPVTEQQVEETITYAGRGVFGSFSIQIVDGINILVTDTKLTVLQSEVIDSSGNVFIPEEKDKIDGYRVIKANKDPADVSWAIQLRKA